jgi:hypothetical protein
MRTRYWKTPTFLLICFILFATVAVHYPGLHGDFVFDDSPNILNNTRLHIASLDFANLRQAAFSIDSGPLGRPLSLLTLSLNYYLNAGNTLPYKVTNLIIHLLNGLALVAFTRLLLRGFVRQQLIALSPTQESIVPIAVAALWLLHPLSVTSVLYIVQRMNSLSTLFTLLGLIGYLNGRLRLEDGGRGFPLILAGLLGGGTLATLCKENGLLLPVYALLIEAVVFQNSALHGKSRRSIDALFLLLVILPALAGAAYIALHPGWLVAQYNIRSFSLDERLLTEARILWHYLSWIVIPTTRDTGLFHDDIAISFDLMHPASTLPAVAGLLALVVLAIALRKRLPLLSFGVLWFLIGQSMESTVVWLELAHEHRNYLPMYGILFSAGTALFGVGKSYFTGRLMPRVALSLAVLALFATVTALRSYQWRDNTSLYLTEVAHHPLSFRANYNAGRQYGILLNENHRYNAVYFDQANHYFEAATRLDTAGSAQALFALLYLKHTNGKPFDTRHWNELMRRLKSGQEPILTASQFRTLMIWQDEKSTHLTSDQILALFDAALDNPVLQGPNRAMMFSTLSGYYANVLHNYVNALLLAQKAIETAPDEAVFNLSMADLYISLHNYPEARRQLVLAKAQDLIGRYHEIIGSLELKLVGHDG